MDLHNILLASEVLQTENGSTGETYTKAEINLLLSKKVDNTDIITDEMIDLITSE